MAGRLSKPIHGKEEIPMQCHRQLTPEATILFAPFGCTTPSPPVLSFLLAPNLNSKDIVRSTYESESAHHMLKIIYDSYIHL